MSGAEFCLATHVSYPGSYTTISLASTSLAIMASMALLQKCKKHGRSGSECQILQFLVMHHAFCTLVLCLWRFHCANTTLTVRFYCACITLSIWSNRSTCTQTMTKACLLCSLYDWDILAALVMRLYCSHGALLYKSSANCSSDAMDLFGHAAAIQIAVLQEDLLLMVEEAERKRRRPKRFFFRAWLRNEKRLQFGHYDQLIRELRLEDINSFFQLSQGRTTNIQWTSSQNELSANRTAFNHRFSSAFLRHFSYDGLWC